MAGLPLKHTKNGTVKIHTYTHSPIFIMASKLLRPSGHQLEGSQTSDFLDPCLFLAAGAAIW